MNPSSRYFRLDPPHPTGGGDLRELPKVRQKQACQLDLEEWASLSGQVVFLVDQEGTILEVSSTISPLLGFPKDILRHRPFEMLSRARRQTGSALHSGRHLLSSLRKNGTLPRWDLEVEDAMCQTRTLRCRGRIIKHPDSSEPLFLILASDLTEQKNHT